MTTAVSFKDVSIIFGNRPDAALALVDQGKTRDEIGAETGLVLGVANASLDIEEGEILVLMGLSGSGKSTLLRCLSRLVEPTAGALMVERCDLLAASPREMIEIRRKTMGMVFQHFGLLPHLDVLGNVAFPLRVQGMAVAERHRIAREMIELVGLGGREHAAIRELSGGQQQRVGIARSLAVGPKLWFLDEPFSALDPLIRREMQDEILRLQRKLKKTIVFVTHDIQEAFRIADRMVIMRDGRIVQMGRPAELLLAPADDYVSRFMEDVPRGHVLTAGDIARDGIAADSAWPMVLASRRLDSLLAEVVAGHGGVCVQADSGEPLGSLSASAIANALEGRP